MLVLREHHNPIKSYSNNVSYDFKIGKSEIIFDMLTNKLYSNPLYTVIREYLQNARDSHREAGCEEKKIDVTLPTRIEPVFKIRDYGVGISPERMREVFVVFGETTKMNVYEHGGFGIGATSIWSYTDAITVKSYVNNKEYIYIGYIGDNGIPKMDLISENDSDEPKGVEISFSVKEEDFGYLETYFNEITYFWKNKPNVINSNEYNSDYFDIDNISIFNYDGVYLLYGTDVDLRTHDVTILYDEIPYPVKEIDIYSKLIDFSEGYNLRIFIKANVNDINISLNREQLKYDKLTVDFIKNKIIKFVNKCKEHIRKEYNDFIINNNESVKFSEFINKILFYVKIGAFLKDYSFIETIDFLSPADVGCRVYLKKRKNDKISYMRIYSDSKKWDISSNNIYHVIYTEDDFYDTVYDTINSKYKRKISRIINKAYKNDEIVIYFIPKYYQYKYVKCGIKIYNSVDEFLSIFKEIKNKSINKKITDKNISFRLIGGERVSLEYLKNCNMVVYFDYHKNKDAYYYEYRRIKNILSIYNSNLYTRVAYIYVPKRHMSKIKQMDNCFYYKDVIELTNAIVNEILYSDVFYYYFIKNKLLLRNKDIKLTNAEEIDLSSFLTLVRRHIKVMSNVIEKTKDVKLKKAMSYLSILSSIYGDIRNKYFDFISDVMFNYNNMNEKYNLDIDIIIEYKNRFEKFIDEFIDLIYYIDSKYPLFAFIIFGQSYYLKYDNLGVIENYFLKEC